MYEPHLPYHSSVNRHLGCFHDQAIVNSATVKTGIHVSVLSSGVLRVHAQKWMLGHMAVLFLAF